MAPRNMSYSKKAKLIHAILAIKGLQHSKGSTINSITNYVLLNLPVQGPKLTLTPQIQKILTSGVKLGILVKKSDRYQVSLDNFDGHEFSDEEFSDVEELEESESVVSCDCRDMIRECVENSNFEQNIHEKSKPTRRRVDLFKSPPPCKRRCVAEKKVKQKKRCLTKKKVVDNEKERKEVRLISKAEVIKLPSSKNTVLKKEPRPRATSLKRALRNYKSESNVSENIVESNQKKEVKETKVKRKVKAKNTVPVQEMVKEDDDDHCSAKVAQVISDTLKRAQDKLDEPKSEHEENKPVSTKNENVEEKSQEDITENCQEVELNDDEMKGEDPPENSNDFLNNDDAAPRDDEDLFFGDNAPVTDEDNISKDGDKSSINSESPHHDVGNIKESPSTENMYEELDHDVVGDSNEESADESDEVDSTNGNIKLTRKEQERYNKLIKRAKRVVMRAIQSKREKTFCYKKLHE